MDHCAVPQSQVDQLTCENTSPHWHSQAPDKPRRAPFATQSATHFDLADEPSDEVVDIRFDDSAIRVHGLSLRFTSANRLRSARGAVQACASNATQTVLDRRTQDRTAALALEIDDPGAGRWEALRRDLVELNHRFRLAPHQAVCASDIRVRRPGHLTELRPSVSPEIAVLLGRLARENHDWGH